MPRDRDARVDEMIAADFHGQEHGTRGDQPSIYSCPDCGGVLWQVDDEGTVTKFACHTGHRYDFDELVVSKSHALEQAVIAAVRLFHEKAALLRQLALLCNTESRATADLLEQAEQDEEHARLLRATLLDSDSYGANPTLVDATAEIIAEVVREVRRRTDD